MDFAPIQYTQISRWIHRRKVSETENTHTESNPQSISQRNEFEQQKPDPHSNLAFKAIALLNLPAFINYTLIKSRATLKAIQSYETWSKSSLLGRWTSPTLERWNWKQRIITTRSKSLGAEETLLWTKRLGLSSTSPLWTWLTSGFLHERPDHLLGNMLALLAYSPLCARIPGMSALHVGAITLGASILASAAQLLEWRLRSHPLGGAFGDRRTAMGASGIVSAFAALAAVAAPNARLGIPVVDFSAPVWVLSGMQVLGDVMGLLRLDEVFKASGSTSRSWSQQRPRVGYAAHLGGAVFGVVYYFAVLRNLQERSEDDGVELENGTVVINQTPR
ncbi:hypothetical protein M409DRAFT_20224 [Zasmidium cellare ATCC 36951]|uniref:Peptidase S54 rhomboid domain-containing protein n=1 Tax=Zasmidium cellare ATCC 36951 TaxID=1080233 RepID=A0A6A6CUF6_ZASCE|nr:uncharacterized protein M409DRAFT_20224 [Zasmidium cellare ATCC 36951]KAF2169810.1 hypothetical protein M409DRAFT_20224 [Zasmidium cellare ATCC 36951]